MRIVDIRETAIPLKSDLRNSGFDFSEMTTSVVAVITDVIRDGKPVAGTEVTLIAPDKSTQKLVTDAKGEVTAPAGAKGRYLLTAALKDEGAYTTPAGPVAVLHRITTISYLAN